MREYVCNALHRNNQESSEKNKGANKLLYIHILKIGKFAKHDEICFVMFRKFAQGFRYIGRCFLDLYIIEIARVAHDPAGHPSGLNHNEINMERGLS